MATATTLPAVERPALLTPATWQPAVEIALGSSLAFALLGYHPYAEDGGIYAAALVAHTHPSLFPVEHAFAIAHTAHSLFIPLLALLAGVLHASTSWLLLLVYAGCLAATVAAARSLLSVLFPAVAPRRCALLLTVVSLGLPVAGTSLYLFDPYLTARSISTPLLLWALALLLENRARAAAAVFAVTFLIHPMMAASSALLFLSLLALRSPRRVVWMTAIAACALAAMALLRWLPSPDPEAVRAAATTRAYWFPSQWAWYELAGLFAPLLLLSAMALRSRTLGLTAPARQLAAAAALATAIAGVGTLLFVHPGNASMLLARMQPLRLLHVVYVVMVLLLGGLLGKLRARAAWTVCAVAGASLFGMQRGLYEHSTQFELPWRAPANGYEQAFLWARDHTPQDALFALDAGYTAAPGEDAQLFRAIAQHSSLPDAAKDGGIASVMPHLAGEWQAAAAAQTGLATLGDQQRVARVGPMGATWIVLPANAATHFACPYTNAAARVCTLP